MRLRRLLTSAGLWLAAAAGVAGGVALAVWSTPIPAFSFNQVSVVGWRGNGDSVPENVAEAGWSGPMFYTAPAEGAGPDGPEGRYPTGWWAPGDSARRVLVVRNVDPEYMMLVDRLQVTLRGDLSLTSLLALAVQNEQGRTLYEGSIADITGDTALLLTEPLLLRRQGVSSLSFTVSLDRSADNRYQGRSVQADVALLASQYAYGMSIDVHPSSWPNPINPGAGGRIPVAVNGGATLDVQTLDGATARFGPNRVSPVDTAYDDWNDDGYTDLVLKFDNRSSGFTCGMAQVIMTITAFTGEAYEGADQIRTPSCS